MNHHLFNSSPETALFDKLNEGTEEYEKWLQKMGWYDQR